jgi:riboflavin transporter
MKNQKLSYIAKVGVLSAIAIILYYLEFPIFPAFPWLMIDFSEITVLLGGFALGPLAGILIELIKNILHFAFKGATGGVGELANFLLGAAFILPTVWIYKRNKCIKNAVIGMIVGIIFACAMSVVLNLYLFIPLYFPTLEDVWGYIIAGAVPVTAIKFLLNGIIVYILYPRLSNILHK